jgi:hypothetical protein
MQLIRDHERMGLDAAPRLRQGVNVAAKLHDFAGCLPARELAPHVRWITVSGQQQAAAKHRQTANSGHKIAELHCENLPN